MSTETKQIETLVHNYAALVNERNVTALAKLYATDGIFMPNGYANIIGAAGIAKSAKRKFAHTQFQLAYQINDITIYDKMAIVNATAEITTDGADALSTIITKQVKKSRDLFVLQQSGDEWLIIRYMFNDWPLNA